MLMTFIVVCPVKTIASSFPATYNPFPSKTSLIVEKNCLALARVWSKSRVRTEKD